MSDGCDSITPISAFQSTNLSSKIDSFSRLGDRIMRSLGAPLVNVELHSDQVFENISIACELFTKFCGHTEEYLIFNSNLYIPNRGVKMDDLFSTTPYFKRTNKDSSAVYITLSAVPASTLSVIPQLSTCYLDGIYQNQILTYTDYLSVVNYVPSLVNSFTSSNTDGLSSQNAFDYDTMDYRKVVDIVDFQEGSNNNVNTLFTIEQSLAQQTYFSYAMGNYGFDLISWYTLKNWLDVREKVLAQKRTYTFNDRTQYMVLHPSPGQTYDKAQFWGILACSVERPLRDIIKEQWVLQYSLALCKITLGMVRGKYQGTTLFGGGTLNANMLEQGYAEKEKLEERLFTGSTPGFGDGPPPAFMVG